MKRVTVGDLKDQIGMEGQRSFLWCSKCGNRFSANTGDYFMRPDNYVFKCCRRNMKLVTEKRILTECVP